MARPSERLAITGVGVVSALGPTASSTFERMARGDHAFSPLSAFDVSGARARLAAEVPKAFLTSVPDAAAGFVLSPSDRLAFAAAREALEQAGLSASGIVAGPAPRGGLSVGGTTGGLAYAETMLSDTGLGFERARGLLTHPLSSTVRALDALLGTFARTSTVCTACSSGAVALVEAASWLVSGELDWALAGGVDALCRMTYAGFDALGALAPEPCRPFDVARRGLTLGEGGAFLVLEAEAHARARGARILGWFAGFALGSEAHHVTHPEPSGRRAAELMRRALAMAGRSARDLDYVNAHGTGTPANDAMEAKALREVLGGEAGRVRVSSSKGQLGHTLGAAGALEAALTVLSLERGLVLPTGGLSDPEDPGLRHVLGRAESAELRAALSSSFGFGGMNAVLLFEAASEASRTALRRTEGAAISAAVTAGLELDSNRELRRGRGLGAPLAELDPERSRRFDRGSAAVTRAVQRVLEASGAPPRETALSLGSAYGCVARSLAFLDRLRERGARFCPPAEFPQLVHSALASNASIYLGLEGPAAGVSDGDESGASALARALSWLELDQSAAVVAGAIDAHDPVVDALLESSSGRSRGEGGGLVLLERASDARARGHAVLANLKAHVEERSAVRGEAPWAPPATDSAALVLAPSDDTLVPLIEESSWRAVRRYDLGAVEVSHSALSAAALSLGAQLVAAGAREVLMVCGSARSRYVTRLESPGEGT